MVKPKQSTIHAHTTFCTHACYRTVLMPMTQGFGNLRTANWRTGNMRTSSANYGREPRVQCEPESANFLCNTELT